MSELSKLILKKLVSDEKYCRKALPFIRAEYFEGDYKVIYKLILGFMTKYNSLPNCSAIEYAFGNLEQQTDDPIRTHKNIREVFTLNEDDQKIDLQWILEQTEKWCKDRSIYLAVIKSINIIDGKDDKHDLGAIPDILSKALSVSFDRSVGHDYIDNAEQRFDFYHTKEDRIQFDLDMLNRITKGGVPKKTLNVVMAPPGKGKSLVLCHLASAYLAQGKNVLYITLEMAEERIAERIDANLFDIELDNIFHLTKKEFGKKIAGIRKKSQGKLIIKEYPTASAHVGHFRALIDELKIKKSFTADVIIIDYLNICSSSRLRSIGGSVNTYSFVKAIAEEIRGLAIEYNVPIWSATQTNRCLTLDTLVKLENGDTKCLCDICVGDKILSSSNTVVEVKTVYPRQIQGVYCITTKSGKHITASQNHVFPSNSGLVSISAGLEIGTKLITTSKHWDDVTSITYVGHVETLDIEVTGNRLFFANDILTHNSGIDNSDVDMTNMSESIGLGATADLILSLITSEQLDELGQCLFKQLKNRYSDVTKYNKFVVGIDRSKMRLYDVENSAQSNVMNEVKEFTTRSSSSTYEEFKI